jgi:cation diffusion facilitator family transporter
MNDNCSECGRDEPERRSGAEKASMAVSAITLATMAAEICFGVVSGSMALLADGIHMGTHAFALFITAASYFLARKHRRNPSFSFGTGKIGVLGGYTNALLLGITAFYMIYEAIHRLTDPQEIAFDQALLVAVLGLAVNLACALILNLSGNEHGHGHAHEHEHEHEHRHSGDSNLRAAFLHVATDALTSVLAISALLCGKYFAWNWLDSAVALLGAALILKWSFGLLKDTASLLLDFGDFGQEIAGIRKSIEGIGARVRDIHIWRYSESERSLILSLEDPRGRSSAEIKEALGDIGRFHHVTIEVTGE